MTWFSSPRTRSRHIEASVVRESKLKITVLTRNKGGADSTSHRIANSPAVKSEWNGKFPGLFPPAEKRAKK